MFKEAEQPYNKISWTCCFPLLLNPTNQPNYSNKNEIINHNYSNNIRSYPSNYRSLTLHLRLLPRQTSSLRRQVALSPSLPSFSLSFSDFFLNQPILIILSNNASGPESFYYDDGGGSDSVANHTRASMPPHLLKSLYQVFLINK